MVLGRGNAHAAAMLLLIFGLQRCILWQPASAATHTVGGAQRWDVGVDYTVWAAGQTFIVGDILFFPYSPDEHNLVVVQKAGYDACSVNNAISTFINGNTNVTLNTTGPHYYLCSFIGHCGAGMKLAVTVSAAVAAAPPTPTAGPPVTPPSAPPLIPPSAAPPSKPTPVPTPTSPAPTPNAVPVPAPSSPAPTPSAQAPGSTSTPVPTAGPPGSTPSTPGTPPSTPPSAPPNAAPSFLASGAIVPFAVLWAALMV